jgi:hypothetical protein
MHRVVIGRAVSFGAADDPNIGSVEARRVNPSGADPLQPGGITRKLAAAVPVVRQPGDANTSVHMSSIGSR